MVEMEQDLQLAENIQQRIVISRPNIVSVPSLITSYQQSEEAIINVMDSIASESQQASAAEDYINRVFCLKGHVTHSQFNVRLKVVRLVNEEDIDKGKAELESVEDCKLYGLYQGTVCSLSLLQLASVDKSDSVGHYRVSLPESYTPDGNCSRSKCGVPGGQTDRASTFTDNLRSEPSTSKYNQKTELPSSSIATSSKQKGKHNTQGSNAKSQKNQPKLFFNQSTSKKTSTKLSAEEKSSVDEANREDNSKKESPGKSSDKENMEKSETKKKPSRIQMFSSSESDSEPESAPSKKPAESKKKDKSLVNNTGLLLDPDDIQNESDEEEFETEANVKKRPSDSVDTNKSKRRKRSKNKHEDVNTEENGTHSKQNFGSVKVGERCSSMKYVDKTFIDDEGFMVTEKVLEEVEPESPPTTVCPPVKSTTTNKKVEPTKKSKPIPKQQSSLLKFFKPK
ncbi:hypothetical protein EB796_018503 [Bugula neritina]|uniref:DNA polymerase delta subunit 3 n=1 Tax=Bugula neritina TaxID=10212 RepID=A0A7J7JAB6_BUGNE|nr:hypothetical protein EB796_018503 [Bugula neritina]